MKEKKVIIVGAGLAGLSAAYELCKQKNIDLHIIEEKSEVGGRVCTKKINACPVDFGAFIIYPWYKRFNELILELKCKTQLKKIPLSEVYYDIGDDSGLQNYDAVKLPLSKSIKFFVKTFPEIFVNNKPAQPRLSNFKGLNVKKYFTKKLNLKKNDQYLNMLDTILQGYCYASIDDYKMAFLAATIHQNVLHGDLSTAFYFPKGTQAFAEKMAKTIKANGGKFHLNTKVLSVSKNKLVTDKGDFSADAIVFAKTASDIKYTHFITALVEFKSTVSIDNDKNWGACMYRENTEHKLPILSSINLKELYSDKMKHFVTINIKVRDDKVLPLTNMELLKVIHPQLKFRFPNAEPIRIVEMINWKNAMPVSDEKTVDKLNKNQGHNAHYYAGDFMGCPSMETALMTGKNAAKKLIEDIIF